MSLALPEKKYPRLLALVLSLIGLILTPGVVLASTLALSPSSGTFNAGCSYSLAVLLDTTGTDTDGTDVILDYDQSKFTMNTVTKGTLYPDYPISSIDAQSGKVSVSGLASVSQPYNGSGTFATINFTIPTSVSPGATSLTFEFDPNDPGKTTDSNVVQRGTVQDTLSSVTNGNYTIGSGACTSVSTAKTTTKTATTSAGLGDFTSLPATPSATPIAKLPTSGSVDTTKVLTVVGSILTVLGIAGLALL